MQPLYFLLDKTLFHFSIFVSKQIIFAYLITSVVHLNIISIHIDILVGIVENMCWK